MSSELTTIPEIALVDREGEPRARDVDVAKSLGFARPRKLRDLIERHRGEMEGFGELAPHHGAKIGRGRPEAGYLLNEEQALLVAALSDAPNAPAVRSMLIRTFVAWRRGHLIPQALDKGAIGRQTAAIVDRIVKTELAVALQRLLPSALEQQMLTDPRRAALDYVSVRQLLDDGKALSKGRRSLNRKVGSALKGGAAKIASKGEPMPARTCPHTGVWLYQRDYATAFMRERGNLLVADHNAAVMGQSVIPFPKGRRVMDTPPSGLDPAPL